MARKGKITMANFKDYLKAKSEKTTQPKEKFEGYWKEDPNLSLAQFRPNAKDKDGNEIYDENLKKVGWDARNGLNKTLKEIFDKDKNIIPQLYTEEGKNDLDRIAEDPEFKNKNTFPARANVTVEYAVYTKDFTGKDSVEHKKGDPIMKKDGTQAINAKAEYSMGKDILSLSLTNKGEITDITARTGVQKDVSATFVKKDDLANSDLDRKLKALAAAIIDGGYVKTFEPKAQAQNYERKGMSPNAKLFAVCEYIKDAVGVTKVKDADGNEKDNYDNATAFVHYNKEENGHPASVSVNYDTGKDTSTSISIGIAHGDFYAKSTELVRNTDGKFVPLAKDDNGKPVSEFVNEPADLAGMPENIGNALKEILGFEQALFKASQEISATMTEKTPDGKPSVFCAYHNGRDTLYIKDSAADKAIEVSLSGKVSEITVTDKDGKKEYNRKDVDASSLTGVYKEAYDKADACIKMKREKEKGQEISD